MTTAIIQRTTANSPKHESHVWTVFLDLEGTDPQVEVFASENGAHKRAASLAGTSAGLRQADGSTCYQDGVGNFYTVRKTPVQV